MSTLHERKRVLAIFALLLGAAAPFARAIEEEKVGQRSYTGSPGSLFCAGVSLGEAKTALHCASSREDFLEEAARTRAVPAPCANAPLPNGFSAGRLLRIAARDGECALKDGGPLEPGTALLCGAKLDINRIGVEALELLPGIGPSRAQSIAKHREENGPFSRVEDLEQVPGIGPKTVEKLRDWVVLKPRAP